MRSEIMKNLDKMQKRLQTQDFVAVPTGPFLREWREDFKREAIKNAPRWKGDIVKSIESAQDTSKFPLWARVFSESKAARWSEYGTGILSEDPDSSHQRYFPSVDGVTEWAEDHAMDPYAVALGIYQRGGTPPTSFFRKAAITTGDNMNERLMRFSRGIEHQAGRSV